MNHRGAKDKNAPYKKGDLGRDQVKQGSVTSRQDTRGKTCRPVVAIIGGGVSGAGVAYHLASSTCSPPPTIVVFEPREELGRGLAYDTTDPTHRINVPAARMSLLPDRPEDFVEWMARNDAVADDPDASRPDGNLFPRRHVFGTYIASALAPLVQSGTVHHRRAAVVEVRRDDRCWEIFDDEGGRTVADFLVSPPAIQRRQRLVLSEFSKDTPALSPTPPLPARLTLSVRRTGCWSSATA